MKFSKQNFITSHCPHPLLSVVAWLAITFPICLSHAAPFSHVSIVFQRDSALWKMPAEGSHSDAKMFFTSPHLAIPVSQAITSGNGKVLVLQTSSKIIWIRPSTRESRIREFPCEGNLTTSYDGNSILCQTKEMITIYPVSSESSLLQLPVQTASAAFLGSQSDTLVLGRNGSIWSWRGIHKPLWKQLAPHQPASHLLPSPDGTRAVAVYRAEDNTPTLYSFALNGKGSKRRLMNYAEPISWSLDSQWILLQNRRKACIVRAIGGQYKCWRRYRAISIFPDGRYALVTKTGTDLYRAVLAGARTKRPVLIQHEFDGVAVWMVEH